MKTNTYYRLPFDQYGQPNGLIESYEMTEEEYLIEQKYNKENWLAMRFDNYESALYRAEN